MDNQTQNQNLDFLDIITLMSFMLQITNQNKFFDIHDVQKDNNRIIAVIQEHLENQDKKINYIISRLEENNNDT